MAWAVQWGIASGAEAGYIFSMRKMIFFRTKYLAPCLLLAALCLLAAGRLPARMEEGLGEKEKQAEARFSDPRPKEWGEFLPGVVSRLPDKGGDTFLLALTLDACGGGAKAYDAEIIAFLRERKIPATLFVTSVWIRTHLDIFKELAADPLFEIAAHGRRHKPASVNGKSAYGIQGTVSVAELVREVEGNAEDIQEITGRRPLWYRSGTAFYDDVAVKVIGSLDMAIAGYSIAGDEGASLPAREVEKKLLAARPGDIILCHFNHPESGTREGLKAALPLLLEKGAHFVRLSEIAFADSAP